MGEKTPTYFLQLKAMLIRNILLKKREKRKTTAEVLVPCLCLGLLIVVKLIIPTPHYAEIRAPRGDAKLFENFRQYRDIRLAIVPNTSESQMFMDAVNDLWLGMNLSPAKHPIHYVFYENEEALLQAHWTSPYAFTAAVIFETDDPINQRLSYKIRLNPSYSTVPVTTRLYMPGVTCRARESHWSGMFPLEPGDICPVNNYFYSGFVAIQALLDYTKIRLDSDQKDIKVPEFILELMPKSAFTGDWLYALRVFIPYHMMLSFSNFITYLLILIVGEKEKKIKEGMKIMGLRDSIFWLSWFIIYGVFVLILSIVAMVLLISLEVFKHSNMFLIFLLIYLYSLTIIMMAFVFTPFFNKGRTAGVFGPFAVYVLGALYTINIFVEDMDPIYLWFMTLISCTGFALAMDKAVTLDSSGQGVRFSNLWSGPGIPFGGSIIMMLVDIILYGLLAYYLDSVIPSDHGSKHYPWFCFTYDYWFPKKTSHHMPAVNGESGTYTPGDEFNQDVEPVAHEMKGKEAIKIVGLQKTFKKWYNSHKVTAVDGVNLTIYEGQITAMLGHNGAGKTTVFNMLTGLAYPTSGTAYIFGYDIRSANDMYAIRSMTGVCPQHDILFDLLTPREHLEFYAAVKGVPPSLIDYEVARMLSEIELSDQANTFSHKLSGGQKRKLSVGIALIGDPKIIILDEPTAGVDAFSRRHLWSLLQNRRHGKVILLTTHFMDEADILADRKAIISKGRLRCCGSSLFLKNKFGIGYHLTLVLEGTAREQAIVRLVTSHVAQAEKARRHGRELSFILPRNGVNSFPPLFQAIEQEINTRAMRLGISSYGVSMTTLEEVFLQLEPDEAEGEETDETIENISKKMVRNRALSRSLSLQSKSTSYQSLQNEGNTLPTPGSLPDGTVPLPMPPVSAHADGVAVSPPTENPVIGLALEPLVLNPNTPQILMALVKIRVLRVLRDLPKQLMYISMPFLVSLCVFHYSSSLDKVADTLPSLELSVATYYNKSRIAVHNGTTNSLDEFLDSLNVDNPQPVTMFNGNFSLLLDVSPHLVAFNINVYNKPQMNVTTVYNDSMFHSLPIAMNMINNAFYRLVMEDNDIESIRVRSHPLQATSESKAFSFISLFYGLGFGSMFVILSCTIVVDLVYDREIKAKNQLRVNGLSFSLYFVSYFIVLGVLMFLSFLGFLLAIFIMDVNTLNSVPTVITLTFLFFFYIMDSILFTACCTYIFDKMETAQAFVTNILSAAGIISYGLVILILYVHESASSAFYLHCVLALLFSPYIPFAIVYYVDNVYQQLCPFSTTCRQLTVGHFLTDEIIVMFVSIILHVPLFSVLLLMLDIKSNGGSIRDTYKSFLHQEVVEDVIEENTDVDEHEDDDVKAEREKVNNLLSTSPANPPVVVVQNLRKEYKISGDNCNSSCCTKDEEAASSPADVRVVVRNLSMAVDAGEVFGLLGHNGAGKTTTMKILIAEEAATKGRVQIGGHFITTNLGEAFKVMGYCPQFDAQWKDITVREHLECYSAIRGVSDRDIPRVVDLYMAGLQIQEHSNKQSQQCSGGTRRKLSFSMAMAGDPRIVLLDEPSTGMDPRSKRFLWDTILASFQGTRGAILTTHSMEEADALCSRVGIMVQGSIRCLGSTQHLKNRYGAGYKLEMKLRGGDQTPTTPSSDRHKDIKAFVRGLFRDSVLEETFADRLVFSVPQSSVTSLAQSFRQLEKAKVDLDIEEYSFSQTTLEQVFLKFAH
ncbi:cholesterol transporter ABCA5 [Anabrus simplex]|uniref:cholesterol transporter ABCA5 n=1 Tax=Anabrus simplex TaxID=316456 RepID=UPI0034DD9BA6